MFLSICIYLCIVKKLFLMHPRLNKSSKCLTSIKVHAINNNMKIHFNLDFVMDLGFKLTSYLNPGLHIDMICCKAPKMLGFVIKLASVLILKSSI